MFWTSVMVQWLRLHLPMQGTWVRSLAWEDSACFRATKPTNHNCSALQLMSCNYWSPHTLNPCSTTGEANTMRSLCIATKSSDCSPQLEKARVQQQRPSAVKKKLMFYARQESNFTIFQSNSHLSPDHLLNILSFPQRFEIPLYHLYMIICKYDIYVSYTYSHMHKHTYT